MFIINWQDIKIHLPDVQKSLLCDISVRIARIKDDIFYTYKPLVYETKAKILVTHLDSRIPRIVGKAEAKT